MPQGSDWGPLQLTGRQRSNSENIGDLVKSFVKCSIQHLFSNKAIRSIRSALYCEAIQWRSEKFLFYCPERRGSPEPSLDWTGDTRNLATLLLTTSIYYYSNVLQQYSIVHQIHQAEILTKIYAAILVVEEEKCCLLSDKCQSETATTGQVSALSL